MSEYGIVCLIPPAVAIILALWTRQTLLSLFFAVWAGATILSGYDPLVGFTNVISDYIIPSIADQGNAGMLLLVTTAGGFIYMLRITGAAESFAGVVTKTVNTAGKAQIVTWCCAFLFSYTEPCLILGTIMRPVTDRMRVSRAKLAYILDSMGCNLASFSPISSYGPFIAGLIATQMTAASLSDNAWSLYLHMMPFNLYGIFAMITVLVTAALGVNIGPMHKEEKRARETGKLLADGVKPLVPEKSDKLPEGYRLTLKNFIIPMATLFLAIFATVFWSGNLMENGFRGAFINGNITLSITVGFLCGSIAAGAVGVCTGLFGLTKGVDGFVTGMQDLITVPFILILAWSVGSVTQTMKVGDFLSGFVAHHLTGGLVPALIFLFGALISFATGSSWGVWSIMMPIAIPMALAFSIPLPFAIGAVIGGGLFGDQCSPISDTTIMSSTGASCNHIVHVSTQLPYGITVGISAFAGFLFGGMTGQYMAAIPVTLAVLAVLFTLLTLLSRRKNGQCIL